MKELQTTVKYILDSVAPATIPAILVATRDIIQKSKTKKNKQQGGKKNIKGGFGKEMIQDAVTELYKVAPAALLVAAQRYLGKSKTKKQKGGNCQSSACNNNQRVLYSSEGNLQCDNAAARGGQQMNYTLPNQKGGGPTSSQMCVLYFKVLYAKEEYSLSIKNVPLIDGKINISIDYIKKIDGFPKNPVHQVPQTETKLSTYPTILDYNQNIIPNYSANNSNKIIINKKKSKKLGMFRDTPIVIFGDGYRPTYQNYRNARPQRYDLPELDYGKLYNKDTTSFKIPSEYNDMFSLQF